MIMNWLRFTYDYEYLDLNVVKFILFTINPVCPVNTQC